MSTGSVDHKLERIEDRQTEILVQLAAVVSKLDKVNGSVADLLAEVGNVPPVEARGDRKTITSRMHSIEATMSPAAFEAAMTRVMSHRRVAIWKQWQLRLTLASVVIGTVVTILRFAGFGG